MAVRSPRSGSALASSPLERAMVLAPPARDLVAAREPDTASLLRVLDELGQAGGAGGLPREPRVEADRHHPRVGRALFPEVVERAARVVQEVVRAAPVAAGVAAVVVSEAVGDDQVVLLPDLHVVGQVVVIGVAVVEEAGLDE